MQSEFTMLGSMVAQADIRAEQTSARTAIDQGIRAALLCTLFGVEREAWVWPFRAAPASALHTQPTATGKVQVRAAQRNAARMLGDLMEPLGRIGHLGTLAGASDLDPMDPGPSHTVLAATLAACVAQSLLDEQPSDDANSDAAIGSAVLAGVESAWRVRGAITGTRPGVGFHSPGVFGTLAAAAAGARMLGLAPDACASALAIALTRASGLGINSAASMIGMTHFGWGALHGLEAALLASQGWDASRDLQRALATLFGEDQARAAAQNLAVPGTRAADALVFKRYPCNIYLNLLVAMLEEVIQDGPVDRIEVSMPWVPHLDCAQPKDLRQARNSAQAVAAIAGAGDVSYAAFSGPPGPWVPGAGVARLLPNVQLLMDKDAPTGLRKAVIGVRAWRGASLIQEAQRSMQSLRGWGAEHARRLMGPSDPHDGVAALYNGSYLRGFAHVKARLASVAP
ncbi:MULTISPECIES: MmgE/PrpD family protein [unclassified Achromobacter]|uniref:MmgE/PrpD family protein n=1 Tax=unclassified Achromobacter TaxID=2626865 RepID=UPI0013035723|nr:MULTISPECIES: MmgE/PrpD family protein [unclassified Achromobacter]